MEDHLFAAELPVELLAECLALLPRFRDLLACACVSRHWNIASDSSFVWKRLCNRKWFGRKSKKPQEKVPTLIALVTENASWKMYVMHRRKICASVDAQLQKMMFRRSRRDALNYLRIYADYVDVKLETIRNRRPLVEDMTRKSYATYALKEISKDRLTRRWEALGPLLQQRDSLWKEVYQGACLIDCWMNLRDSDELEAEFKSLAESISVPAHLSLLEKLHFIIEAWKNDWNFCGNTWGYYEDQNSFISACLKRRKGIPISLSVIFASICRHHGVPIDLVGCPGHFVVSFPDGADTIFIDVFNGCELRTRKQMEDMIGDSGSALDPITPLECYARMLRNLTLIYQQASDFDSLIEINDQQMILGGGPPPFETLITGVEVRAASTQYEKAIEICDILMALPALPQPVLARAKAIRQRLSRELDLSMIAEESICPAVEAIAKSQMKRPKYRIGQVVTLRIGGTETAAVITSYDLDNDEGAPVVSYQVLSVHGKRAIRLENALSAPNSADDIDFSSILRQLGEFFERQENALRFTPNEKTLLQFPTC